MTKINLLAVEDDPGVADLLSGYLGDHGYAVTVVQSIAAMRTSFDRASPDIIVLDVGLPDGDGWEALRWLRQRSHVPVMMLTGHGETVDKVLGLELGADDYLSKPFELREVLARLHTIERRRVYAATEPVSFTVASDGTMRLGGLEIDTNAMTVRSAAGEAIKLTQAEFRILVLLAETAHAVVTREILMENVVGRSWDPTDRSIDVHVSNLRKKLAAAGVDANAIRTVRGQGYRLAPGG